MVEEKTFIDKIKRTESLIVGGFLALILSTFLKLDVFYKDIVAVSGIILIVIGFVARIINKIKKRRQNK